VAFAGGSSMSLAKGWQGTGFAQNWRWATTFRYGGKTYNLIPRTSVPKRPAIVVGEGMDRINAYAADLRAQGIDVRTYSAPNMNRTLNPNAYGTPKSLDANWHWLDYWARGKEVDVYNIGLQPGRTTPSPYFWMENRNLIRWERAGEIRPVIQVNPGY
jgi:hypothetical protein